MKRLLTLLLFCLASQLLMSAHQPHFGETLCHDGNYFCIKIRAHESWAALFPNDEERDLVKRVNRMNTQLKRGMTLAIPKNLNRISLYDISPFPRHISSNEKAIYISQRKLAWAAYDETGTLIWWGPISSGMGICPNVYGGCTTPAGSFRIIRKQDNACISTAFPKRADGNNGGTAMPFCMHFFRGYALHGSDSVPGYRASHGCIRLFTQDARWLNEEFVDLPQQGGKGTRIVIDDA